MYTVRNFASTGDATGGVHSHSIIFDPNYCALLNYAQVNVTGPAADIDVVWLLSGPAVPAQTRAGARERTGSAIGVVTVRDLWLPPAFICPGEDAQVPTLSVSLVNADTEILSMNAVIFLFDIRARESARYSDLVAARGGI